MPLCKTCEAFDLASLLDQDREVHDLVFHKSISKLKNSESTCDFCGLLWTTLTKDQAEDRDFFSTLEKDDDHQSPIVLRGIQYVNDDYEPGAVFRCKVRCDRFRLAGYVSFYSAEGDGNCITHLDNIIFSRRITPAEKHLDLLREWADDCDQNHSGCHRDIGKLPTRVIDVGEDGKREPRLVETEGNIGRYMTLSHCWGLHPVIQTTSLTIGDHLKALPLSKLPNTFRDAVIVTRAMGIQYLWIDSLCIIQDSKQDWERESANMGSIYFSSYLTIAASGSTDSRGGCFIPRDTFNHVELRCSQPDGNDSIRVMVRPQPGDFVHLSKRTLHTRAWVLQEKILSSRMINFDTDQLLWQCQETLAAEDGILPGWKFPSGRFFTEPDDLNLSFPYTTDSSEGSSFEADWNGMVAHYASRGITKSFDKLPALSGLAKAMEDRTGIGYAAGLWKANLAHSLLWGRVGPWLRVPTNGYRAPSWSWAALEGGISMTIGNAHGLDVFEPMVEEIEITIEPGGLDPRGMIKSGHLMLSGRVRAFDKRQNPQDPGYFHVVEVNSRAEGAVSDYLLDKGEVAGQIIFDEPFKANDQPLYCLQVVRRKENHTSWHGLILESTGREKEFRRLGRCFTVYVHNPMWFDDVPMERIKVI
ncbi:hypothetical protein GQ607_007723 [Colletotrichum asianum]|uniref:Heterokaryon incompatibility domain-containing protein n=1 Tax=Colletotrichum asianum TaxID=702518 RepID=A0A8H3ZRP5_9PEZI|nr:hypothetical protein GQ607_007723 [Colletotrichum asianum]